MNAAAAKNIRPNGRAGLIVNEMLDKCEVPRLPSLSDDRRIGEANPPRIPFDFRDRLRPGMGAAAANWLIYTAQACWKMCALDQDVVELRRYLAILGTTARWMSQTIYPDAVMLCRPAEARGRLIDTTGGKHDFPASCPLGWTLADGTLAGERCVK